MRSHLARAARKKAKAKLRANNSEETIETFEQEALKYNVLNEYEALKKREEDLNNYDKARYLILRGIVKMVKFDPIDGDMKENMSPEDIEYWANLKKDIKEGGKLLYQEGGMSNICGMHDELVWAFIPQRIKRDVDILWNGIGEWKC
jgi:hypothetical protein